MKKFTLLWMLPVLALPVLAQNASDNPMST